MKWAVAIVLVLGLCALNSPALAQQANSGPVLPAQPTLGAAELRQPAVASQPAALGTHPLPNVSSEGTAAALLPSASSLRNPTSPNPGMSSFTPYGTGLGSVAGAAAGGATGRGTNPTAPVSLANPFAAAQGYATTIPATIGNGVGLGRSGGPARGAANRTAKPYAGFTPPSPVSPYMNLFRNDGGGAVNNYYSLVRPAVDQRNYDLQTQRDIQSLQTATRAQSQTLNQLNSQAKPAATGPASSFQNLQNYYPGLDGSSP